MKGHACPGREDPKAKLVYCLSAHMHSQHAAPDVLQAELPGEENSH